MDNPSRVFDVAIIGGGPAGMAAALWCVELGLTCVLIEKNTELGGQLLQIHNPITNYPAVRTADGTEMRELFIRSLSGAKFEKILGVEVVSVNFERKEVALKNGEQVSANAIIIATGVRRRALNLSGEKEFRGRGILESGSKDRKVTLGKRVVIIGGGDAAIENSIILSEYASHVIVVHRRDEFTARAEFLQKVRGLANVELRHGYTVEGINGSDNLTSVTARHSQTGETETLDTDFLLIRIGVEPNSEIIAGGVELDPAGYIKADSVGKTSREGVFAAGDVACPLSPTISTAAGTASTAVKAIKAYLDASGSL